MTRADRRWVINVVFSFAFFAAGPEDKDDADNGDDGDDSDE